MNSIFIPKSIKCQSNILDEEIKAFYSLHPVNASNSDYDFNTQLDIIITEYMVGTQSFKTPNARRCFKKQLKKMILVDKPNNSKKYEHFLSWRLKQIAIHKYKQRDEVIKTIENQDMNERFNELSKKYTEQNNQLYALIEENQELKEKLKKYEREIIIEEVSTGLKNEESSDEESSDEEEIEEIIKEHNKVKPEPVAVSNTRPDAVALIIMTKNTLFQQYADMETDGARVNHYWEKIDECIDEIEKFFIKNCNRDENKITELINVFCTFHDDEFENITESSAKLCEDEFQDTYNKLNDRPFSILRGNLNKEATL
jgi:adenosyl cobinamide kinase/adenosyl cobinamide phosphate guanylyltransferase